MWGWAIEIINLLKSFLLSVFSKLFTDSLTNTTPTNIKIKEKKHRCILIFFVVVLVLLVLAGLVLLYCGYMKDKKIYKLAKEYHSEGSYIEAINIYNKISSAFPEYKEAMDYKQSAIERYIDLVFEEAVRCVQSNAPTLAIKILEIIKEEDFITEDPNAVISIQNMINSIKEDYVDVEEISPYFCCNVQIDIAEGEIVNIYNIPIEICRSAYLGSAQTLYSTKGIDGNDGSIWYEIAANDNEFDKTFWVKYEIEKMKVTDVMPEELYTLTPKCASNLRLDVAGASNMDGANVWIYSSNGTAAQQWLLRYCGEGFYMIISRASGKALDVYGASTEMGTNVQQYTPNDTAAQQWMLKDAGDGYYYLIPKVNPALCLDVTGAGIVDETNVYIYTINGTDAQKWMLTPSSTAH